MNAERQQRRWRRHQQLQREQRDQRQGQRELQRIGSGSSGIQRGWRARTSELIQRGLVASWSNQRLTSGHGQDQRRSADTTPGVDD